MKDIAQSVGILPGGKQCPNRVADQRTVIDLLNQVAASDGGRKQAPLNLTPVAGICAAKLHQAILQFQAANKAAALIVDGHLDPGRKGITRLNVLAGSSAPGTAPPPAPPAPGGGIGDTTLPPKYAARGWPATFTAVIQRSYVADLASWKRTFEAYLDDKDAAGFLAVFREVHDRLIAIAPYIWTNIAAIYGGWTYGGGHGISQGFNCKFLNTTGIRSTMNGLTAAKVPRFCRDIVAEHGPRDCYREHVMAGPGLHVCVTVASSSEMHDIHIDHLQVVCNNVQGWCIPVLADPNTVGHLLQAMPWVLTEWMTKYGPKNPPNFPKW